MKTIRGLVGKRLPDSYNMHECRMTACSACLKKNATFAVVVVVSEVIVRLLYG